jgi:hypothetical protein
MIDKAPCSTAKCEILSEDNNHNKVLKITWEIQKEKIT